jgi:hypothetical protein
LPNHTDNAVLAIVIGILRDALNANAINAGVRQVNQPRQQGTPTKNTILINKVANKRYGYLGRTEKWYPEEQVEKHTESQWIESMFQIGALAIQNPADINAMTASDLINFAAQVMQSDATLSKLRAQKIGIYRITAIRNPYFVDDKERFEASPSFDFTLTYEQVYISEVPVLQSTEFQIRQV